MFEKQKMRTCQKKSLKAVNIKNCQLLLFLTLTLHFSSAACLVHQNAFSLLIIIFIIRNTQTLAPLPAKAIFL